MIKSRTTRHETNPVHARRYCMLCRLQRPSGVEVRQTKCPDADDPLCFCDLDIGSGHASTREDGGSILQLSHWNTASPRPCAGAHLHYRRLLLRQRLQQRRRRGHNHMYHDLDPCSCIRAQIQHYETAPEPVAGERVPAGSGGRNPRNKGQHDKIEVYATEELELCSLPKIVSASAHEIYPSK